MLIAIWAFFSAFLYFVGVIAIAVLAFPEALGYGWGPADTGATFGLSIGTFILLCRSGLSLAGGIGILQGKSWGRIFGIVVAALSLFWFPIGTVLGISFMGFTNKKAESFRSSVVLDLE